MSQKLHQAIRELSQAVEIFEKSYFSASMGHKKSTPQILDQRDLFGLSQYKSQEITQVLDRTISKMEKLIEETANG